MLTRLPAGWLLRGAAMPGPGACVWAYPLAGLVIGAIGAAVNAVVWHMGATAPLAAAWTLVAMAVATGGLHEDGLADTADGFGGGRTPERKLAIMRDSRIGAYGVLALVLAFLVRAAALAALNRPVLAVPALLATGALSRASIAFPLRLAPAARADGLAAALGVVEARQVVLAAGIAAVVALMVLPFGAAIVALVACSIVPWGLARLAVRQIGGYTGDVLGACAVASECLALSLLSVWLRNS